jgi:Fe-Mn family superoxide dismutase
MPATLVRYEAKPFTLQGLKGLSDEQMAQHLKLYEGYITNTNLLNEQLAELRAQLNPTKPSAEFAEIKRRLGFEYNGMVLHEQFFGNLKPDGGQLPAQSRLAGAISRDFGSVEAWDKDFRAICHMRGVGWAILYQDPTTGRLNNHWITLHEEGHIAGYKPILVIDIWEHAFTVDYKPTERAKYVEAVLANIDWAAVEKRLVA